MITAKGDITNMKKRPTFMKESSNGFMERFKF
jgi:hypothetical protein